MLMKIVMKLLLNISTLEFQDMDYLGTFVSKKKLIQKEICLKNEFINTQHGLKMDL